MTSSRLGIAAIAACLGMGGIAIAQPAPYDPRVYRPQPPPQPPPPPDQPPYQPPPQPYQPPPEPQPQPPPPPPTHATFISLGEARFDVRLDDNAVCTTPCSIAVDPLRFVTLHSHDQRPTKLSVGYMPSGDVLVRAKPRANAAFATGVTFTSLTGLGLATGITLTAVGYGTDRSTMARAGVITGVASGVGLYLSIKLLLSSLPSVEIGPASATPYVTNSQVGFAGSF